MGGRMIRRLRGWNRAVDGFMSLVVYKQENRNVQGSNGNSLGIAENAQLAMLAVQRAALIERRLAGFELEIMRDAVDGTDRYQQRRVPRPRMRQQRP